MKYLLIVSLVISMYCVTVFAQTAHYLDYQGILVSSGQPITDSIDVTFRIYSSEVGGTSLWDEVQTVTPNSDGVFSVTLGVVTPLATSVFDAPDRWLGVKVSTEPEFAPRVRLMSAPYAFHVHTLNGASGGTISSDVQVAGWVHSTSGGFRFPDGSELTSAPGSASGDITAVYAEDGLTGDAESGDAYISVGAGDGIEVTTDLVNVDAADFAGPGLSEDVSGDLQVNTGTGLQVNGDAVELTSAYISGTAYDGQFVNENQTNSVNSSMIIDGTMGNSDLGDNSVSSQKILDGSVALSDLGNNSVNSSKIVDGSISQSDVSGGYVNTTSSQTVNGNKTFSTSITVNSSVYANRFYVTDAGNDNALRVQNNSSQYPTIWTKSTGGVEAVYANGENGNGIGVYAHTQNTNALYAKNSSDYYPSIYTTNNISDASVVGIWADVANSSTGGVGTNGYGYFEGGTYTKGSTSKGDIVLTSPRCMKVTLNISGFGTLEEGTTIVSFDPEVIDMISSGADYQVIITPTSLCNGLCVTRKDETHFVVNELLDGKSSATFDWMVIARMANSLLDKSAKQIMSSVPKGHGGLVSGVESENNQ